MAIMLDPVFYLYLKNLIILQRLLLFCVFLQVDFHTDFCHMLRLFVCLVFVDNLPLSCLDIDLLKYGNSY